MVIAKAELNTPADILSEHMVLMGGWVGRARRWRGGRMEGCMDWPVIRVCVSVHVCMSVHVLFWGSLLGGEGGFMCDTLILCTVHSIDSKSHLDSGFFRILLVASSHLAKMFRSNHSCKFIQCLTISIKYCERLTFANKCICKSNVFIYHIVLSILVIG